MMTERWLVRSAAQPDNILVFDHDPTNEKQDLATPVGCVAGSDMMGLFGYFPINSAVWHATIELH